MYYWYKDKHTDQWNTTGGQENRTGEHHLNWSLPGSEGQKPYVFSHMWNIELMQIQQYYEKQVMLRRDHIQEEGV
jgi:hypothetical protein